MRPRPFLSPFDRSGARGGHAGETQGYLSVFDELRRPLQPLIALFFNNIPAFGA